MISEINAEREKSDRLIVAKLNTVKQFNKQDHKSKLMREKYSLLPLNPQQLTPVQTAIQRMSEKHKGMLLQNLHYRYFCILIKLPHLLDLEQQIPGFPNCDNYGSLTASNADPMLDDTPTNDNELHQLICNTFKIDYFQEMDTFVKLQNRLECKINFTLLALLPNKLNTMKQGLVTSGENIRNKRAIPTLVIIKDIAAIGGMVIKGINALVDAKRASSFNNTIKLVNENVQITHD